MSLLRNSSIYTIGNVFPAMAGFILLPLYSSYLSPQAYAVIASMEVIAYIFNVLVNMSLDRAAYRFYFDKSDEVWKKDLLFTLQYASLFFAIGWLLLVVLLQDLIAMVFPSIPFWPFYMLIFGRVAFQVSLRIPLKYFQMSERPKAFIFISIGSFVLNVALVLLFLVVLKQGVKGVLLGGIISSILLFPVSHWITWKYFRGNFRLQILSEALHFCWPFIPILLVAWILDLSDRIFLEHYVDSANIGLYGMAYKLSTVYFLLMGAYHAAYLPHFYKLANRKDQAGVKQQLAKEAVNNTRLHLGLLLLAVLWSHEVVNWFLDEEYAEVTQVLRLLFFSHFFAAMPAISSSIALTQAKKTKLNMIIVIVAAVFNIALNFMLIPLYGIYGAAIATVTSLVILFTIQYNASKKGYFIKVPWWMIVKAILVIVTVMLLFMFIIEKNVILSVVLKAAITAALMAYTYQIINQLKK